MNTQFTSRLRYIDNCNAEHIPSVLVEGEGDTNDSFAARSQRTVPTSYGAQAIFPHKFYAAPDGALYSVPDFARHAAWSATSQAYI